MGKKKFELVECDNIKGGYLESLFKAYQVTRKVKDSNGSEWSCCFIPKDIARQVFGEDANEFLYRITQILGVNYCMWDKETKQSLINHTGYNIMKQYRASVLYDKWHEELATRNEVKYDTATGEQHGTKRINN